MKYKILERGSAEELTEAVNACLNEGWEPLGGVQLNIDRDRWLNERDGYSESSCDVDVTWAQAVVKREPDQLTEHHD